MQYRISKVVGTICCNEIKSWLKRCKARRCSWKRGWLRDGRIMRTLEIVMYPFDGFINVSVYLLIDIDNQGESCVAGFALLVEKHEMISQDMCVLEGCMIYRTHRDTVWSQVCHKCIEDVLSVLLAVGMTGWCGRCASMRGRAGEIRVGRDMGTLAGARGVGEEVDRGAGGRAQCGSGGRGNVASRGLWRMGVGDSAVGRRGRGGEKSADVLNELLYVYRGKPSVIVIEGN